MNFALFIHLMSVIVGFGAVVVVDMTGLLWVLGRKNIKDIINITSVTQPLIWLGYTGLVISGLFLHPNLHRPRTIVKLVGVVILGLNGILLHFLRQETKQLGDVPFGKTPLNYRIKSFIAISISQLFWWTAIIVGFLTANDDH